MTALAALTVYDSLNIIKTADIAAALSFEAQNGIIDALDQRLHDIRPHKGQIDTARVLTCLLYTSVKPSFDQSIVALYPVMIP